MTLRDWTDPRDGRHWKLGQGGLPAVLVFASDDERLMVFVDSEDLEDRSDEDLQRLLDEARVSPSNQIPSEPARSVFNVALEELVARGHESVRAEHVLLGVLGLGAGEASAALDALGVDRSAVRHHLDAIIPPGALRERQGEYPYHATGVAVLEQAMTEARASGVDRPTSVHILLGALEAHGPNSQALQDSGVPVDMLIGELRARAKNSE